jgi:hypothetical protein
MEDSQVRLAGFVAPKGVACDILRADAGGSSSTIFVRRKDHLPMSITTEVSVNGRVDSSTYHEFSFETLKSAAFVLRPAKGERVGKFPVIKSEKPGKMMATRA